MFFYYHGVAPGKTEKRRAGYDKQETYDYLAGRGIRYKVTEHAAVFNMEKLNGVALPYPDCVANVAESGRFDRAHP